VTSAECKHGAPPDAERARCLYDRWLLDVPKLLDVAALYGPTNPGLVSQLLRGVFELQPQYAGDVQVCVYVRMLVHVYASVRELCWCTHGSCMCVCMCECVYVCACTCACARKHKPMRPCKSEEA